MSICRRCVVCFASFALPVLKCRFLARISEASSVCDGAVRRGFPFADAALHLPHDCIALGERVIRVICILGKTLSAGLIQDFLAIHGFYVNTLSRHRALQHAAKT